MENKHKKHLIKKYINEMLDNSVAVMKDTLIDKVLDSGCVDIDSWEDENPSCSPMLIPKSILIALFEHEADQYSAKGTCHAKTIKKEVENIHCFL